jgi:hypothetical protein
MKSITKSQYNELIGLLTLARGHGKNIKECEEAAADILNIKGHGEDAYDRGGWLISDNAYEEGSIETAVKTFLKGQNIEVISGTPKPAAKWTKHINCEGSRSHVVSYDTNGMHCNVLNCEVNKPASKRGGDG